MKIHRILYILLLSALCCSCTSTSKNEEPAPEIPKWLTDSGRLELFPESSFVSQLAYGNTAQESKEKAAASISEYIKSSISYSASSKYFARESSDNFTESKEIQENVLLVTENNLYKIEYTNPYYYADLDQFACVAYINREAAFNFVKPKLEIARTQFPKAYRAALEKYSLLDKIIGIKKAQKILSDFYEVYDFARAINPQKTKAYEEVDALASESLTKINELCSSVLIKIEGTGDTALLESTGVIAELSNQLSGMGFVVGNSLKANCIALVEVKSVITETSRTFQTYPELYIKIIEQGTEKISYIKKLDKVAGFDKETVIRRVNMAFTEDIRNSFVNECF